MVTLEQQELISVKEAARIAAVSPQTIYRRIEGGEVPAVRVGEEYGPLRIPRREFLTWLYGEPEEAA